MLKNILLLALLAFPSYGITQSSELIESIFKAAKMEEAYDLSMQDLVNLFSEEPAEFILEDSTLYYLETEKNRKLLEAYNTYLSWEAVKPYLIRVWAETYTKPELEAYFDFITSKSGASFMQKDPAPSAELQAELQTARSQYDQLTTQILEEYSKAKEQHLESMRVE